MPSKYSKKHPFIVRQKQDAALPYKQHWKPSPPQEMCSNCGVKRTPNPLYITIKCRCGGSFQRLKETQNVK